MFYNDAWRFFFAFGLNWSVDCRKGFEFKEFGFGLSQLFSTTHCPNTSTIQEPSCDLLFGYGGFLSFPSPFVKGINCFVHNDSEQCFGFFSKWSILAVKLHISIWNQAWVIWLFHFFNHNTFSGTMITSFNHHMTSYMASS